MWAIQQADAATISESDLAFYRENGYLVVRDVLGSAQLETLRDAVAEMLAGAPA